MKHLVFLYIPLCLILQNISSGCFIFAHVYWIKVELLKYLVQSRFYHILTCRRKFLFHLVELYTLTWHLQSSNNTSHCQIHKHAKKLNFLHQAHPLVIQCALKVYTTVLTSQINFTYVHLYQDQDIFTKYSTKCCPKDH